MYIVLMHNLDNYLNIFRLLFCIDLAVLIFLTIFADIQRPSWKSVQLYVQGPHPANIQIFNPFPSILFL